MWKRSLVAAVAVASIFGGAARAQGPIPQPQQVALGNSSQLFYPDQRMQGIFQRVLQQTGRRDVRYQLLLERDDSQVNAYALPDGRVVLLTGLLKALPKGNDNAIAFVIAHEISHVEKRHAQKMAQQGGLTNLAIRVLTNGQSDVVQGIGGVGSNLLVSGYSRGMEAEADNNGLELMRRAGYDPRGALVTLKLFETLEAKKGRARVFPTHPKASDRLKETRAYLQSHQ